MAAHDAELSISSTANDIRLQEIKRDMHFELVEEYIEREKVVVERERLTTNLMDEVKKKNATLLVNTEDLIANKTVQAL